MAYSIMQDHYQTRAAYLKAIQEAKRSNPHYAKVSGGMKFFENAEEKRIWQNQK